MLGGALSDSEHSSGPRHLTCLSSLTLGLYLDIDKLKPCPEVPVVVTQAQKFATTPLN